MLGGLGLRVAVALLVHPHLHPVGDAETYRLQAEFLAHTGRLETGHFVRPPLYFVVLAAIYSLAAGWDWTLAARLAQCVASAATAIPVYRSARRIGGLRAARLASAFLLFDPTLIAYAHQLWPETLFLLLVAIVFDRLSGLEQRPRWQAAALGTVTGLAMLLKPVFGLFTLLLLGWWVRRLGLRPALRLALVFGSAAAIVIAPWLVRNQLRYGPAILLENQGPYNLWTGNDPSPPRTILARWQRLPTAVARSRVGLQQGSRAIAADPAGFVRRSAVRALNVWGLEYFTVRNLVIGAYAELTRNGLLAAFWVIQGGYALALLAAALGLAPLARDSSMRLLLLWAVVFTAVVATMVGTTRFRVPFAFAMAIAAGLGVDGWIGRRLAWHSAAAAALALALLALSLSRPVFWTIASGDFVAISELVRDDWRFFRY